MVKKQKAKAMVTKKYRIWKEICFFDEKENEKNNYDNINLD